MKEFFKNVGLLLLFIVGIIFIGIGVEKYRVYRVAAKIDWKVDDKEYLRDIFEEIYLQHEKHSIIDGERIVVRETELTNEPMQFNTFNMDSWLETMSMKKRGGLNTRIMFDKMNNKEVALEMYGLPEISLQSGKIIITKEDDTYPINVTSDHWYMTHFNNESLILKSHVEGNKEYFVSFADDIEVISLSATNLHEKGKIGQFETLLLANTMVKGDDTRFIKYNYETVWERDTHAFYKIEADDLLSLDGQSVLLNYKNNKDGVFRIQKIEQYVTKTKEWEIIKIPEKAVIKKSTLPAVGLGELDVLSFTSERLVIYSNTHSFIVGTAGVVKFSVDLTTDEPHFSIIYVEEN